MAELFDTGQSMPSFSFVGLLITSVYFHYIKCKNGVAKSIDALEMNV